MVFKKSELCGKGLNDAFKPFIQTQIRTFQAFLWETKKYLKYQIVKIQDQAESYG